MAGHCLLRGIVNSVSYIVPLGAGSRYTFNADSLC